jgi:hypothetical protein
MKKKYRVAEMKKPNIPPAVMDKLHKVALLQVQQTAPQHTPERAIKDATTGRIKYAYRFSEEGASYDETLLLNRTTPQQAPPVHMAPPVLDQVQRVVGPATACLFVTYPNGAVYTATAFQVATNPPTFATTRHAFEAIEWKGDMLSHADMFITTRVNASYTLFEAYSQDPKNNTSFVRVSEIVGQDAVRAALMGSDDYVRDCDPCTEIPLIKDYQYDIAFVEVCDIPSSLKMHALSAVLYPSANIAPETVFVLGYPGQPAKAEVAELQVTFPQLHLDDLVAAFTIDHKNLSIGEIEYTNFDLPYIVTHTCSTIRGHSGGPVYMPSTPNSFVGIHLGGMKDIESFKKLNVANAEASDSFSFNYNFAVSTVHPLFVALYKTFIVPRFGSNIPPLVSAYLEAIIGDNEACV